MRIESSWSLLPQAPNIIVPRQSLDLDAGASERAVFHGQASGMSRPNASSVMRVGVRAAALAGVERVDRGELVGGRARSRRRRGSRRCGAAWWTSGWREAVLEAPAQHDLGRGLAVRLGESR